MKIKILIVLILSLTAVGGLIWVKETENSKVVLVPVQPIKNEEVDQKRIDNKKREQAFQDYMLGKTKEKPQ